MNDKPRKQLSLRFDNYAELHDEAKKYCEINNVTLTELVATGLRLAMTSQAASQTARHDKAIENDNRLVNIDDRLAKLEEQLATTSQESTVVIDRELIRDEIAERTSYLANAMNEVKSQLENEIEFLKNELKQLKEEKRSHSPVLPETTEENVDLALPHEQLEEKEELIQDAIAPKATEKNVVSAPAGTKLSPKKLKSIATSIQNTFRGKGIEISQTIIKTKILEMYPNPDDWIPGSDARKDVIRALESQHK